MALLKCPDCGHDVSDKAQSCPNCGCPVITSPASENTGTTSQNVVVTGVDPFAELHTPIAGKKKGNLTCIGVLGVLVGIFFVVAGIAVMFSGVENTEGGLIICLVGLGFTLASYMWARSPEEK